MDSHASLPSGKSHAPLHGFQGHGVVNRWPRPEIKKGDCLQQALMRAAETGTAYKGIPLDQTESPPWYLT
jgi:hypothetical protein